MKKKILSSILSLVFVFSIVASAVIIFPQNAKSEKPPDSTNWSCFDFYPTPRQCNNGTTVIFCDWDMNPLTICCPNVQDLCDED